MADEPEVRDGTRQPSGRFAVDFQLNEAFVESVGTAKAQQFLAVLNEVADSHGGGDREEIQAELKRRLDPLGVRVSDVELDSFADQINRSEGTVSGLQPNPYDPASQKRDF